MKRLPDWRQRLEAAIDDIRRTPFEWGDHDCGPALAGRVVLALTGEDVAAPYRGKYRTASEAVRLIRDAGFADLADLAASIAPEIHPSRARIGDIAAFKMDSALGSALGVVNGERVLVIRPEGIGTMSLLQAHRAFKVG
ncbi:MAG: DUF6950 family protein [Afipia sp.]